MALSKADAPFVFEGSVKSLSASNVSAVPADARTVVVQVEHVRQAPRALAGLAGKEVTVRMGPRETVAAGDKAVFFADALVFGDHLAVQSLGHDPLAAVEARAALVGAAPIVNTVRRRVDQARSVVSGRVTAVRPEAPPPAKAKAGLAAAPGREVISEHAPLWHEAVIDVSAVHKGPNQKQVVVRFPMSTDVRWRLAPRFKTGQTGTWVLHGGPPPPAGKAVAAARGVAPAAPARSQVYTALDPNDFHASSEASVIDAIVAVPDAAPKAAKSSPARAKRAKTSSRAAKGPKKSGRRAARPRRRR
jgi:hypothetical protein